MDTISHNGNETVIIKLTEQELIEIAASKKDIDEGLFIENNLFVKQVKLWLKER